MRISPTNLETNIRSDDLGGPATVRNSCAINNTEYIGPLISERSGLAAWKLQYLRTIPLPSHCISQSRPTARSGRNINLEDWFPAFSTKVVWWLLHYNLEMNPVPKESIQLQQLLDHICQTNVPSLFNRKCNLKKKTAELPTSP